LGLLPFWLGMLRVPASKWRRVLVTPSYFQKRETFFENDVIFIGNDVYGWSISFVTSYLIGQSFCVSIGQLLMKWSFLIGSFSYVLIGVWAIDWSIRFLSL
jgi:hypothetical protein